MAPLSRLARRMAASSSPAAASASASAASSLRRRAGAVVGSARRRGHSTLTDDPGPSASSSSAYAIAERNAAAFDSHHSYVHDPDFFRTLRESRPPVAPRAQSPRRTVPRGHPAPRPPYALTGRVLPSLYPERVLLHGEASIRRMESAARLARRTLDYACTLAEPGVTTDEIDRCVHERILGEGAYPSPLNYAGFPKSLCSSVNEVICHGIPDATILREGDVVSFDVSCFLGGVHGDNCATVIVGDRDDDYNDEEEEDAAKAAEGDAEGDGDGDEEGDRSRTTAAEQEALPSPDEINRDGLGSDWRGVPQRSSFSSDSEALSYLAARRLLRAARESLLAGISAVGPGSCLTDIGSAIHATADAYGYGTVRKYRGHGIGEEFHSAPFVKHYRNSDALELAPGMIFTIEPMITEGSPECREWDDDWTVVTLDGGRAAQFEHTVLVTEDGVRILTVP